MTLQSSLLRYNPSHHRNAWQLCAGNVFMSEGHVCLTGKGISSAHIHRFHLCCKNHKQWLCVYVKRMCCVEQAPNGQMRTVSVMAMKFALVDGPQPVDAHLPQLMPAMLNHIQDQDRYAHPCS